MGRSPPRCGTRARASRGPRRHRLRAKEGLARLPVAPDGFPHEGHPRFQREVAGHQLPEHRLHAAGLDLRQEARLCRDSPRAAAHPLPRRLGPPAGRFRRRQDDQRPGVGQLAHDRVAVASRSRPMGRSHAPRTSPSARSRRSQRRLFGGVVRKADASSVMLRPALRTCVTRPPAVRPNVPRRGRTRAAPPARRKNSRFAGGSRDRRGHGVAKPQPDRQRVAAHPPRASGGEFADPVSRRPRTCWRPASN